MSHCVIVVILAVLVVASASGQGTTGSSVSTLVQDQHDASEFPSCDQCTIFDNAYWCPATFACYVYDENVSATSAMSQCDESCPGNVSCVDFLSCYYGADSCGECLYLGGNWCPGQSKCYPATRFTNGSTECDVLCGERSQCLVSDSECPNCERFNLPLTCSKLLPVIIVATVSTGLFLVALVFICVKAHQSSSTGSMVSPLSGPVDFSDDGGPTSENSYTVAPQSRSEE